MCVVCVFVCMCVVCVCVCMCVVCVCVYAYVPIDIDTYIPLFSAKPPGLILDTSKSLRRRKNSEKSVPWYTYHIR